MRSCWPKLARLAERAGRHYPSIESPDLALNQATAWAIRRVGGHLRANPARAVRDSIWDDDDLAGLLGDAREWTRIRSDQVLVAEEFLDRLVGGLLGIRLDGLGGRLEISPSLPQEWRHFRIRRLRAHRTLLDLDIKSRAEWLTIKVALMFGPPMPVAVSSFSATVSRVAVDEIPMEGPRAVFTIGGEHEVTLYYGV